MNVLILILTATAVMLAVALAFSLRSQAKSEENGLDRPYRDENGDHLYYDESIIAKKEFRRRFPNVRGVRTISRLLRNEKP